MTESALTPLACYCSFFKRMDPDKALDPALEPSALDITNSILSDMETRMKIASSWKGYLKRLHDHYARTKFEWERAGGQKSPGSSTSNEDEGGQAMWTKLGFEGEQKLFGGPATKRSPEACARDAVKFHLNTKPDSGSEANDQSEASSSFVGKTESTPVTSPGFTAVNAKSIHSASGHKVEVVHVDSALVLPHLAQTPSATGSLISADPASVASTSHENYTSPVTYYPTSDAGGHLSQPNHGVYQYAAADNQYGQHQSTRLWQQQGDPQVLRNIARDSMHSAGNFDLRMFAGSGPSLHHGDADFSYYLQNRFAYPYLDQQYAGLESWPATSYDSAYPTMGPENRS